MLERNCSPVRVARLKEAVAAPSEQPGVVEGAPGRALQRAEL